MTTSEPVRSGARVPDGTPVLASRLAGSRAPDHTERLDPLHELSWLAASRTTWSTISTLSHVLEVRNGVLVNSTRARYAPIEVSQSRLYQAGALQAVSLLAQFHQLSTAQVAAFTGSAMSATWSAMSTLYGAGVVQRCVPHWWDRHDPRPSGGTGSLWQLNLDEPAALRSWLDRLEDLEHAMVTSGRDICAGTRGARSASSTRHNLVLAEIALRAAECCPGAVGSWGETLATAASFSDDPDMRQNIADGVVVGRDGSLVVLETSGRSQLDSDKAGQVLADKAASWAAVAARSPVPMKVVFVNISARARRRRFDWHVLRGTREASRYLTRTSDLERAQHLVLTADAYDWFPLPGLVSRGFLGLQAFDPTAGRYVDTLTRCPEVTRADVVVNTLASLHTGAWAVREPAALAQS